MRKRTRTGLLELLVKNASMNDLCCMLEKFRAIDHSRKYGSTKKTQKRALLEIELSPVGHITVEISLTSDSYHPPSGGPRQAERHRHPSLRPTPSPPRPLSVTPNGCRVANGTISAHLALSCISWVSSALMRSSFACACERKMVIRGQDVIWLSSCNCLSHSHPNNSQS